MTVKYVVWCCSIFQMMNFVKWRELLLPFCAQCAGSSEHCVGTLWFGTQLVESHAALLERVERCAAVLECEGRRVSVCYHWHHRQFPLQTRAALWDRLHNKRLHRPLLCYGNYKTLRHLLLFSCTRQIVMCVFSVCHFDIQKKVKIPFGVDDRWPPRLSREKRQTKRWRNRGQISLLRWKKTLKLHLTSVAITNLERDGGRNRCRKQASYCVTTTGAIG